MNVMTPVRDEGTAYEMPSSTYKAALTEVRRGMPMGELLRRYWHPVAVSADASSTPRRVSNSPASLKADSFACASPGIPSRNAMG
jgi:hypothetical protein